MNNETKKFLDLLFSNLSLLRTEQSSFESKFNKAIKNSADLLSKEELTEVIRYILLAFYAAENEMNDEAANYANKN